MTDLTPSFTPRRMGRNPLSKTEKTVKTTIRLPEGLLARIQERVGERGMAKFAREAFEAKLAGEPQPEPPK